MKRLVIIVVCASFAGALAVAGCTSGDGGPAINSSSPFGTEPAPTTGHESAGTGGLDPAPGQPMGGSIAQLCAYDCMRFDSVCPGSGGTNCAAQCASFVTQIPGCEGQFQAYLACLSSVPLSCSGTQIQPSGCDAQISAVNACANGVAAPSGAS
jgi:hypothetical protein